MLAASQGLLTVVCYKVIQRPQLWLSAILGLKEHSGLIPRPQASRIPTTQYLTLAVEGMYKAMVDSLIYCELLCTLQAAVALLVPVLCLVCQTDTTEGTGQSGAAPRWLP